MPPEEGPGTVRTRGVHRPASEFSGIGLREIRAFLVLADELHFGRTAERLGITTSYLSQIVRTLEARVSGRLFDRTSRRVRLTALGDQLQSELSGPYQALHTALDHARETVIEVAGTLRIGVYTEHLAGPHLVQIVRLFKRRHPSADAVFQITGFHRSCLQMLRDGEIEMLIHRLPLTESDVNVGAVLSREERVLLVSKGDSLAQRRAISLEDFADRAVTGSPPFPREMMDTLIPPMAPSGRRYRRIASHTFEEMMMRVALGEQVHPTVASFLEHHSHPGITSVPISDLPPAETGLAWLTATTSATVHAFARATADVLARTELAPYQPPSIGRS